MNKKEEDILKFCFFIQNFSKKNELIKTPSPEIHSRLFIMPLIAHCMLKKSQINSCE